MIGTYFSAGKEIQFFPFLRQYVCLEPLVRVLAQPLEDMLLEITDAELALGDKCRVVEWLVVAVVAVVAAALE